MSCFKLRPLITLLTFGVGVLFVWIYFSPKPVEKPLEVPISMVKENSPETFKIPKGDEIRVEIKYFKPKKAIVTVYNVSPKDVFLAYLPGIKSDWAFFACLNGEKKNLKTGEFDDFSYGCADSSPDLHPLQAGKSFKYLLWVAEPGVYRVNIYYLIDPQLADRFNNFQISNQMNFNESETKAMEDKIKLSVKGVVSESIKL